MYPPYIGVLNRARLHNFEVLPKILLIYPLFRTARNGCFCDSRIVSWCSGDQNDFASRSPSPLELRIDLWRKSLTLTMQYPHSWKWTGIGVLSTLGWFPDVLETKTTSFVDPRALRTSKLIPGARLFTSRIGFRTILQIDIPHEFVHVHPGKYQKLAHFIEWHCTNVLNGSSLHNHRNWLQ